MNFRAMSAFEYVPVGDNAIALDEEAAAARQLFTTHVESFDCNRGRFDTANEIGEKILRRLDGDRNE
jgi:hypothetical protein